MDLGIGRGDSARRVLGKPPITMADTRRGDPGHPRRWSPAGAVEYEGTELSFPWTPRLDAPGLGRGLRARWRWR